jgi:hypothetical protein
MSAVRACVDGSHFRVAGHHSLTCSQPLLDIFQSQGRRLFFDNESGISPLVRETFESLLIVLTLQKGASFSCGRRYARLGQTGLGVTLVRCDVLLEQASSEEQREAAAAAIVKGSVRIFNHAERAHCCARMSL